nr:PREDICTED: RAS protein activator like-3 [Apteryx mantelli mantelli]
MEVEKALPGAETLLKTYKWRTAVAAGEREPERATASPGSRRWARLQGWKRSYSQPESDSAEDGTGKGSSGTRTPSLAKASARRSLFQRAFSAPSKVAKEPRGPEGGKATLQKYLRSMSKRKGPVESGARAERPHHRDHGHAPESSHGVPPIPLAPAPDAQVWDVSNFSLVDGQLVLVGRDEEVLFRSRNRTGSSISESTSLHPAGGRRDPGERARHGTPHAVGGVCTRGFGEKEAYMGFMNEFLEHNWSTMMAFLQSVANPESSAHMATYDGYVDLALELATLHLLLCDIFSSLDQATQEELEPLPTILTAIREGTPVPVSVRLSSTTERSSAEASKPGFVPPRDLSKHSPLIKSQSLISIRRVRSREDGPEPEPAPEPSPRPSRERRNVQRTQSVPAQSKAILVCSRLTSAEGARKKDLERLKASEEKGRALAIKCRCCCNKVLVVSCHRCRPLVPKPIVSHVNTSGATGQELRTFIELVAFVPGRQKSETAEKSHR